MQRNIMTAVARQRFTSSSAITAASLESSRATAFQKYRTTSVTSLRTMGTGFPSLSTTLAPNSTHHLKFKPMGNSCHQQIRNHTKYSGHISKSFTNKNGDTVTYKQNLDPKDARKIVFSVFAVLGLVVCMWFVLCYEIGNLIETVFGWIGRGILVLLSWIWWLGCEVFRSLGGR